MFSRPPWSQVRVATEGRLGLHFNRGHLLSDVLRPVKEKTDPRGSNPLCRRWSRAGKSRGESPVPFSPPLQRRSEAEAPRSTNSRTWCDSILPPLLFLEPLCSAHRVLAKCSRERLLSFHQQEECLPPPLPPKDLSLAEEKLVVDWVPSLGGREEATTLTASVPLSSFHYFLKLTN